MQSAIHMNGTQPFTSMEPFTANANAFMTNPPINRVARELEQMCPHLEGDSYSIETESGTWYTDEGNFETFDLKMQVYCQSQKSRDLLVYFLEDAIERYCATVAARRSNDQSTTTEIAA